MKTISVLSNGARIDKLKSAAKKLKREEGITHAEALDRIAVENGFAAWTALTAAAWTLDDDGNIRSMGELPGYGIKLPIISPLLEIDEDLDLRDWSVSISIEEFDDGAGVYLHVELNGREEGIDFELRGDQKAAFELAVESGKKTDAVAAQGKLVEDVMDWFEEEWIDGFDYHMICHLERMRLGIDKDDIVYWEEGLGGYDANLWAVRVYRAPDGGFLVCYEADNSPREIGDPDRIEPFAMITRAQFEEVPEDTANQRTTQRAFLRAAGMIHVDADEYVDA